MLKEYQKVYLNAVFNSFAPEYADKDSFGDEDISPETKSFLRGVLDHYYKDDETTAQRLRENADNPEIAQALRNSSVNYSMINKLYNLESYFKNEQYDGPATDVKMILGSFKVDRIDGGGYQVTDVYDFANNENFFKESLPGVADFLDNLGIETDNNLFEVIGGGVQSFKEDSSYPLARSIAEYLMPEGSDNSMLVNFTVPAKDEVMDLVLPEPRPDLELAEADDYKFPNVPFTEERKGMFDEFMNFIFPPAQASTISDSNSAYSYATGRANAKAEDFAKFQELEMDDPMVQEVYRNQYNDDMNAYRSTLK